MRREEVDVDVPLLSPSSFGGVHPLPQGRRGAWVEAGAGGELEADEVGFGFGRAGVGEGHEEVQEGAGDSCLFVRGEGEVVSDGCAMQVFERRCGCTWVKAERLKE